MAIQPRIDWMDARDVSHSIPDFIDRIMKQVNQTLPPGQRAQEFIAILSDIDPWVAKQVDREVEILVSRGVPPMQALKSSTSVTLAARRKELFRWLLEDHIPAQSKKFISDLMRQSSDPKERAKIFQGSILHVRPIGGITKDPDYAKARLKETGYTDEVAQSIVDRVPLRAKDIQTIVSDQIARGLPPLDAMYNGHVLALREAAYDYLMTHGVAHGTEFCSFIAAIVTAVVAVACTVVSIAVSESQKKDAEEAARIAEIERRDSPISIMDREQIAEVAAAKYDTFGEARTEIMDFIRTQRFGRTYFVGDEGPTIHTLFDQFVQERKDREWEIAQAEKQRLEAERQVRLAEQQQRAGILQQQFRARRAAMDPSQKVATLSVTLVLATLFIGGGYWYYKKRM